jgi:hypothetical protein
MKIRALPLSGLVCLDFVASGADQQEVLRMLQHEIIKRTSGMIFSVLIASTVFVMNVQSSGVVASNRAITVMPTAAGVHATDLYFSVAVSVPAKPHFSLSSDPPSRYRVFIRSNDGAIIRSLRTFGNAEARRYFYGARCGGERQRNALIPMSLVNGGEGGIRTHGCPAPSVSYRFYVARNAINAMRAAKHCPLLPANITPLS